MAKPLAAAPRRHVDSDSAVDIASIVDYRTSFAPQIHSPQWNPRGESSLKMNTTDRRTQLIDLVREKDRLEAQIERLNERSRAIDQEIDNLLQPAVTQERKFQPKAAKAKPSTKPPTAPIKAKPTAAPTPPEPAPKPPESETPTGAPLVKDRLLDMLRKAPEGVEISVLAKHLYGGDQRKLRSRCQGSLGNLQKKNLVRREGTRWFLVPPAG